MQVWYGGASPRESSIRRHCVVVQVGAALIPGGDWPGGSSYGTGSGIGTTGERLGHPESSSPNSSGGNCAPWTSMLPYPIIETDKHCGPARLT